MASAWAQSVLLTRGQIAEISGVSPGTLAFWLKNDLLVASSGGAGKGSHKKFKPIQASIAAILGRLQQFGVNIASLKAFSEFLQQGVRVGESCHLHPISLIEAVMLKRRIVKFELGESVSVYFVSDGEDAEFGGRIADSVSLIERDFLAQKTDHDPAEDIVAFARVLTSRDLMGLEAYAEVRTVMDGLDWSDPSWLIWQNSAGEWEISSQPEPSAQFTNHPQSDTAIFIAIGSIIRGIWGIDIRETRMEHLRRRIPDYRRSHPQIAERMTERLRALEKEQSDG
ncbi:MAG: hypothetical protein J7493_05640 [Porphyrobacter sp.]|nr:hypothetical protein [Porphyrobacter sp.]